MSPPNNALLQPLNSPYGLLNAYNVEPAITHRAEAAATGIMVGLMAMRAFIIGAIAILEPPIIPANIAFLGHELSQISFIVPSLNWTYFVHPFVNPNPMIERIEIAAPPRTTDPVPNVARAVDFPRKYPAFKNAPIDNPVVR